MRFHFRKDPEMKTGRAGSLSRPTQFYEGCSDLVPRCMLGNHSSCFVAVHSSTKVSVSVF